MNPILIAVVLIAAVGLVGAVLLVAASRAFAVTEDERVEEVTLALPGANCGACGYAGCASYAKAVAEGAPVNQCMAGGPAVAEKLAAIMGVEAGESTAYKAIVACRGTEEHTRSRFDYRGIQSCQACNVLYNGHLSCPFGCLGFGDCVRACKFGAIQLVDGVARVDPAKCTGCGACKAACPKKIIFLYHEETKPVVMCSNHKRGADTRKECTAGCIGCHKCEKECPAQAITVRDNVARIDYDKCTGCNHCADICPVHAIQLPPPLS